MQSETERDDKTKKFMCNKLTSLINTLEKLQNFQLPYKRAIKKTTANNVQMATNNVILRKTQWICGD